MTADGALAVWDRSHAAFYDVLITAAPGARIVDVAPGVRCALTPTAPERSIPNAVLVEEADALREALPAVRELYAGAGVRAWTVWVGPGRDALEAVCREAGLAHDGSPPLMHAALADLALDADPPEDVVDEGPLGDVWAVDDVAFGMDFSGAFTAEPVAAFRRSVARVDGMPAGAVCWVRCGDDAFVFLVGVLPEARGRGLCTRLMAHVLRTARAEGASTTTLEASPFGFPVYARMGYTAHGPCGLWESRVA